MSASKVIWCSSQINRSRKLLNAKQLNDISIQSLKFQVLLFLAITIEMCFNVLLRIFRGINPSIYMYALICKTFLAINIFFIISYSYQIIEARLVIYLEIRENKTEPILKSVIFEILPQAKYYYTKLIECEGFSKWLNKDALEQNRIKSKLEEERCKTLRKMYLPSLFNSYECIAMNREMNLPPDSYFSGSYQEYASMAINDIDVIDSLTPLTSSTPYSKRRVMQSFQGDVSLSTHSPFQHVAMHDERVSYSPDMYGYNKAHSFDSVVIKYQPSSSSPIRINTYSPLSVLASYRNQSSILSEVPSSEVWQRLDIDSRNLDQWILNMRQWLHGTIISRVVQEIEKLNQRFLQLGINDVVIGESNVQTLRQLANQPGNNFPNLSALITFLDCSKDQGYVVNRIKELSQGCSLGKFQWNSGSTGARHPWKEHLPNDSMLILHLLSTYIDSRVHSNLHGVRTFSQQFIIDNFDNKEPSDLIDICALLQSNVQPPHFKVIFDQKIYAIAAGRRNLLECLIVFFYKVYKNEGNLKWLNLGRSGLNLNWIFDD